MYRRQIVMILLFFVAVTFSLVTRAEADPEQIKLRLQFSPKTVWKYNLSYSHRLEQAETADLEFKVVCTLTVIDVDKKGNGLVRATFEPTRLIWRGQKPIDYDAQNPPWEFPDALCEVIALGGQSIEMTVAPNGQLISGRWVSYDPKKLPQHSIGLVVHEVVGEIMNFGYFFGLKFPDTPVNIGATWQYVDSEFVAAEKSHWQILYKKDEQVRMRVKHVGGWDWQMIFADDMIQSQADFDDTGSAFYTEIIGNAMVSMFEGWPTRVDWEMVTSGELYGKESDGSNVEKSLVARSIASFVLTDN